MAILSILEFPDPRLRNVAKQVEQVDDTLRSLVDDMLETMYQAEGIGLAATQVDVHQRVIVMDVSEQRNEPLVFINPEVEVLDQTHQDYREGCLSVPGYYEDVSRPQQVKITALDHNGETFVTEANGLLAVCIQHEIDHLNGKLFVDYLSTIKRNRIKQKLQKERRLA